MNLVIKAPNTGIAPSPHFGVGDCRNLDISTIPGVARLNNLLAKKSSTTVTGLVQWFVKNPVTPAEVYALDNGGNVYRSGDSGATWALMTGFTAGGHGNGLAIWKNYLFVARDGYLDVCGDGASSGNGTTTGIANANWTNSWKAIDSDVLWHPMTVSFNDNKLYGGAGKYVFSLDEVTAQTFAPATAGTYTWTQQALDLPPNYRIKSIAEQGNNLMCGTWMGTNVYDYKVADIFPWDRSSPSFGSPIKLAENGINAMVNINGVLYIAGGIDGKLYSCNGVQANIIAQIPSSIASLEGGLYLEPLPGSLINFKGRPFFGVSTGGTNTIDGCGVWSLLQTSQGNILNLEHGISTGNFGSATVVKIGALLDINRDTILVGWRDGTGYGIDKTSNTLRTTSYGGYFESAFYNVGNPYNKVDFTQGMFQLAQPLATGEGIQFKYRTAINASWTSIETFDFATYGVIQGKFFKIDIKDIEFLQVRVEMTTGASNTTPQFKQLILIG